MSVDTGHGQRLSAVDASFLDLESAQAHMHMAFSAIFSVPAGARRPSIHTLRARVSSRLHLMPRCRQRLHHAPLGLGAPRWIDDPLFEVEQHVMAFTRSNETVAMESFAALRDLVLSEPLFRDRPLWHILLIPRLEDGRVGLVGRVHHGMADGTAAMQIAELLLDSDTELSRLPAWSAQPAPGRARWALDPFADGAALLGKTVCGAAQASRRPRSSALAALNGGRRLVYALRDDTLPRAPRSPLNVRVGQQRTLVGYRTPVRELRAAAGGGTLNDAGLTVVAGALRALMIELGETPHALKVMMPVSLRRAHQRAEPGNRLSSAAVWLPLHLSSPQARLRAVCAQTEQIKGTRRHEATATLLAGVQLLPGPPRHAAFRAAASPRAYNLLVSSIPAPRTQLSMLGTRLQEIYPAVPVGHDHALAIGMLAYDGQLHIGLHGDPDALPEIRRLPGLLAHEVAALSGTREDDTAVVTSLFSRRPGRAARAAPDQAVDAISETDTRMVNDENRLNVQSPTRGVSQSSEEDADDYG